MSTLVRTKEEFLQLIQEKKAIGGGMHDVYLYGGPYDGLVFRDLDLSGLNMAELSFEGALFDRVQLVSFVTAIGIKGKAVQFHDCIMEHMNFSLASLEGMFCRGSKVNGVFQRANLEDARFSHCDVEGIFYESVLSGARFESCEIKKSDYAESVLNGAVFEDCWFKSMWIADVDLTTTSFRNCIFTDVDFCDADASGADFCGADLRGVRFGGSEGGQVPKLVGAKYDSNTKFPKGFEPSEHGMIEVKAQGTGNVHSRFRKEEGSEVDEEVEPLEGVFLMHPVGPSPSVLQFLGGDAWPPSGYKDADVDRFWAGQLGKMIKGLVHSSNVDLSFTPFVLRPGSKLFSVLEKDSIQVPAEQVMLGLSDSELAEEEEQNGSEWWKEYYEKKEYKKLLEISGFMFFNLKDVAYGYTELSDGWAVAWFSGVSQSGSRVGLLAPRYDPE